MLEDHLSGRVLERVGQDFAGKGAEEDQGREHLSVIVKFSIKQM